VFRFRRTISRVVLAVVANVPAEGRAFGNDNRAGSSRASRTVPWTSSCFCVSNSGEACSQESFTLDMGDGMRRIHDRRDASMR